MSRGLAMSAPFPWNSQGDSANPASWSGPLNRRAHPRLILEQTDDEHSAKPSCGSYMIARFDTMSIAPCPAPFTQNSRWSPYRHRPSSLRRANDFQPAQFGDIVNGSEADHDV